jgi:hypothetical protein
MRGRMRGQTLTVLTIRGLRGRIIRHDSEGMRGQTLTVLTVRASVGEIIRHAPQWRVCAHAQGSPARFLQERISNPLNEKVSSPP